MQTARKHHPFVPLVLVLVYGMMASANARAPLPLYTDHLVNAFQDWSWGSRNLANSSPVYAGTNSIRLSGTAWNVALALNRNGFNSTPYGSLSFWGNGGSGGQILQVYSTINGADGPAYRLTALPTNSWKQFLVPLVSLGANNKTNLERVTIQLTSYGTTNAYYLDEIQFTANPPPAAVQVSVNATQQLRTVDGRWFGLNTAIWDSNFDTAQTVSLLKEAGTLILRFPGGSLSDEYHWASGTSLSNTWRWATSFANFAHVATNLGVQAFITVNYGTGTPAEATNWVRHANVTSHFGFKYWEIGNECYGTWETDTNANPHDPYTYAVRTKNYLQQMKAADPTIKVGIVVTPGEDNSANGYSGHPATNLLNGTTHYGWTAVVLSTLRSLGVTPDFAIHHRYPEYTSANSVDCPESDPLLLQDSAGWAADAADLRRQITAYFGPAGTNIELVCTENNCDAGAQGRQSTSLVNALYYADSLGQLMKTEFNAFVWWDLRNGTDTSGSFDSTLYGWRTNGDLGMIGGLSTRYPPYYASKLMRSFARPGDAILNASSDYLLLSAYAARCTNGAVKLLVLNKDSSTNISAQITVRGFVPASVTSLLSYGIPQDTAARTGIGSEDIQPTNLPNTGTNFSYNFPALSLTLLTLAPASPSLAVLTPGLQAGGQFSFQLRGQPGVRYVIQRSPDLSSWIPVATNTLIGVTTNLTLPSPAATSLQFWRAAWQP